MSSTAHEQAPHAESLFSRWVAAPVLFVSLIFSLFVIDSKNHGTVFSNPDSHSRARQSSQSHDSKHQRSDSGYISDPNRRPGSPKEAAEHDSYYHSNVRHLARRELEDAFELRSKLIACMLAICGIAVAVIGWGGAKLIGMVAR